MAEVRERPILFSGPMVRAILKEIEKPGSGKTQTRRLATPGNSLFNGSPFVRGYWGDLSFSEAWVDPGPSPAGNAGPYLKVPRAHDETVHRVYPRVQPGDRLWVRETWAVRETWVTSGGDAEALPEAPEVAPEYWRRRLLFQADQPADPPNRWRPSIHVPRWASRISLEVTGVRVERLQEITEQDAAAEGISMEDVLKQKVPTRRDVFRYLWDYFDKAPWTANPWVWVIEFRPYLRDCGELVSPPEEE